MKKANGFIPLVAIFIAAVALGTGAVATYEASKPEAPANPVKTVMETIKQEIENPTPASSAKITQPTKNQKNCPKPNTWSYVVTQEQIDLFLKKLPDNISYAGYKVKSTKVNLEDNGISATVGLNDSKAVFTKLKLNQQGTDFEVVELKSVGENKLSGVELAAIRLALLNADKLVWNYVDSYYKQAFQKIDIQRGYKADIFFFTREYINCSKEK